MGAFLVRFCPKKVAPKMHQKKATRVSGFYHISKTISCVVEQDVTSLVA